MSKQGLLPKEIPSSLRKGKIRIAVVGLGRIGLPTAAIFAKAGAIVTGLDIRKDVVKETNAGRCWLTDEPGLPDIVKEVVNAGNLKATLSPEEAISRADFVVICVPTPVYETKTPDYSAIQKASKTVGAAIKRGSVVIIESTVGPGIVEEMVGPMIETESGLIAGKDFGLASCPERSDPGSILQNLKTLPRIIGGIGGRMTESTIALYEAALGVKAIRVSDPKTANAAKLTENLFRDVNIALANEFALLFEELGVDAIEVINACASKYNFMPHYPGLGVGGPCLVGDEFVYLADSRGLHVKRFADQFTQLLASNSARLERMGSTEFLVPEKPMLALSFDGRRTTFKRVLWLSRREYSGKVKTFRLTTNRYLTVTQDHQMMVNTAMGVEPRRALDVQVGQELPISKWYEPPFQASASIDLIEEILMRGGKLLSDTKIKPIRTNLREYWSFFGEGLKGAGVPTGHRMDYLRYNYLPLHLYADLGQNSKPPISRRSLLLYTSRGRTCRVPATFDLDENFWRFIGYYASEGCIVVEKSVRGERRRIKISFGQHEKDLIIDCRSILNSWGIRAEEEIRNGSHSLKFSSSVFAFLLKDVLQCGKDAYTKAVPSQLFVSSRKCVASFLRGLFRGDGSTEKGREFGKNVRKSLTQSYATTSPALFQGVLLLLQAFGITPTCRKIVSKKSTVPADALRISRYEDLLTVNEDIGGIPRLASALVTYYRTTKNSPVLVNHRSYASAFVKETKETDFSGFVYNMEVEDVHTFVTSFGIVTHNCLPSNSYYLISEGVKAGNIPYLIRLAREVNDRMPDHAVELVGEALNEAGKTVRGSRIAVLGVAYKPNIKDIQLTPVERVVTRLRQMGAKLEIYDPMFKGEDVFGLKVRPSLEKAVRGADCLVVGTAHDEFRRLDLEELSSLAGNRAAFVDARNVVSPSAAIKAGFAYRGVGRRPKG